MDHGSNTPWGFDLVFQVEVTYTHWATHTYNIQIHIHQTEVSGHMIDWTQVGGKVQCSVNAELWKRKQGQVKP